MARLSCTVTAIGVSALLSGVAVAPALAAGTPQQRTWHADQARVPAAQEAGRGGAGVTVAVLDSWVDGSHPDFEGRVLAGADCTSGTCRGGQGSDACDHGTHVGGTVAASSFGVAPKAKILPVRVLSHDAGSGDCVGRPGDVAAGIRWAVAQGAQVLNLSLGPDVPGLSASSAIPGAVREAAAAGVVVVFSAGNNGAPITDSYGGNALIVAATAPSGRLASYSQRGTGVDLAAPGGDPSDPDTCRQSDCVTSLFPGNRYAVSAGTSMAAPHVSGIAALLIAQRPSRGRADVVSRLTSTARPLAQAGSGLVDATAALGARTASSPRPRATSAAPAPVVPSSRRPVPRSASPATRVPAPVTAPTTGAITTPKPSSGAVSAIPRPSEPSVVAAPAAPPVVLPVSRQDDEQVPVLVALVAAGLVAGGAAGVGGAVRSGRTSPR